jgi:hypothetical protein
MTLIEDDAYTCVHENQRKENSVQKVKTRYILGINLFSKNDIKEGRNTKEIIAVRCLIA